MKNLLLLFGVLLIFGSTIQAQTDAIPLILQKEEPYYGIGLQAGLATGSGVMFRAIIPERFAVEATIGVITLGDYTYFSSGLEGQFRLNPNDNNRIFLLAGGGFYSKNKGLGNIFDAPYRLGIGAGYDWLFGNHNNAMLGLEIPLTVFFDDKTSIIPTPQLSFMYYFR